MIPLDARTSHGLLPAKLWSLLLAARVVGLKDAPPSAERLRAIEMMSAEQLQIEDEQTK